MHFLYCRWLKQYIFLLLSLNIAMSHDKNLVWDCVVYSVPVVGPFFRYFVMRFFTTYIFSTLRYIFVYSLNFFCQDSFFVGCVSWSLRDWCSYYTVKKTSSRIRIQPCSGDAAQTDCFNNFIDFLLSQNKK